MGTAKTAPQYGNLLVRPEHFFNILIIFLLSNVHMCGSAIILSESILNRTEVKNGAHGHVSHPKMSAILELNWKLIYIQTMITWAPSYFTTLSLLQLFYHVPWFPILKILEWLGFSFCSVQYRSLGYEIPYSKGVWMLMGKNSTVEQSPSVRILLPNWSW